VILDVETLDVTSTDEREQTQRLAEAEKEEPEQQTATFVSRKGELKTSLVMKPLGPAQESSREGMRREPITIK